MKRFKLNELRELFLSFFEERGHLRLPGFSLIPRNDASLLLINSGMAPMKTWFTGEQEPPGKRVCTCQKCIRTGDIDSVGKTSRHGTYFEMLGNFSFGDYFKHDAIVWCWEFLTGRLGIDPKLLYPSVYLEDSEAFNIWNDVIGVSPERIIKLGKEDNFWDHGSGPCGPCSEVYFDRGSEHGCGKSDCAPGCDCDRYIEVWNNVFTQFDNDGNGNYAELTQKNIDTGLGLERLACVCQGVDSIFEVDSIKSIVTKVADLSGVSYGHAAASDVSIRIITDHIRAATMMICDGILPSNEGRGYVLRRLLRRAARHGKLLGITDIFLGTVCDSVITESSGAYLELSEKSGFIKRIIQTEEEAFAKTIDAGMSMLDKFIGELKKRSDSVLSGTDTFKLYDTFGFPLDLTVDILTEHGMTVDVPGFDREMDSQRTRARAARESLGDLAWERTDLGLDSTPTQFVGYDKLSDTAIILAISRHGEACKTLAEGDEAYIILDKTPFYAEMGGQAADIGILSSRIESEAGQQSLFNVTYVQQSKTGKYLHHGKMHSGSLSAGDTVSAAIDIGHRDSISRAHSSTHLLHKALRTVLGEHVNQAGSLVEPDKLRFDFTHFSALTGGELCNIERIVNDAILENRSVLIEEMPVEKAKKLGATALFGEKYSDVVRVVKMGDSIELCGGTHLDYTARAGLFTILSEFSVASGVRRIEAVTGYETLKTLTSSRRYLHEISAILKVNSFDEIISKVEQNLSAMREMRSKLESAVSKQSGDDARNLLSGAVDVCGIKVISTLINDVSVNADKLRHMGDALREIEPSIAAVLVMHKDEKLTFMAACGKAAVEKGVKAGDLMREVAVMCGGSGGGKPEFAMGGAKDSSRLKQALEYVSEYIRGKLAV